LGYLVYLAPFALELVCIVHAVRTGRVFPWVYVIVFLPVVGSLAYVAVEFVPEFARGRASHAFASGLTAAADPNRGLRQAKRAAEMVGSVAAKRTLAEAYVARGQYADALALYESLLVGQFREDPALLQGLAHAQFLAGDGAGAQASFELIRKVDPNFLTADAQLLYARTLELQGKDQAALAVYKKLVPVYPGAEARCRYGMLLQKTGSHEEAREQFSEIVHLLDGAPGHYRRAQREWGNIAKAALR
jgi:hypothetical protein